MKIVCSSRDSAVGVGTILVLTVDPNNYISNDENGFVITDVKGNQYEVYDFVPVQQITKEAA